MKDKVYKIIVVIVLFSSLFIVGQEQGDSYKTFGVIPQGVKDSLHQQLNRATDFKDRAKLLKIIAEIHIKLGNTDSIIYYGNSLKEEALNKTPEGLTNALWLSRSYVILGKGSLQKGLYDDAMEYYLQGIEISPVEKKPLLHYQHKLGLALVYIEKGVYKDAMKILDECLNKSDDLELTAFAKKYYGDIYLQKDDLVESKKYYKEAMLDFKKLKLEKPQLKIQVSLGTIAILENDFDNAYKHLKEVKNKSLEKKYYDLHIAAVLRIGHIYSHNKQYEEAQIVLSTAYVNAVQWNQLELQKTIAKSMIALYVETEDYKNAYNLMTQYEEVSSQIINNQKRKEVKELEIKYQTAQKENEILTLQEEQLLKESEIKRQKTIKNAFLIGFLVVLIPIIALLYMYYQKLQAQSQLNVKQEEINRQKVASLIKGQELKLVKASIEAQDEERGRIARELHDSIGGNLAAIKLQMNNLNDKAAIKDAIVNQLDETYQQVREISHNLIPSKFSQNAFTTLISEYIDKLDKASDQDITFNPYPKDKINALDENLQVEVFNILQELITNTLKHAKAKNVEIHVNIHNKTLQMLFEDNGVGFDKEKMRTGIGLQNIKSRLEALQGNINIDSTINRGTAVTIEIPINYDTSN
jgi:signal transduction histidine kinase